MGDVPQTCRNCGATLVGPWCHVCGQHSHGHRRSLHHLIIEAVETLTHADGRLWRTLRLLAVHPARLTNDYLAGHRVSQIPPFRLLLVVLFVLFGLGLAGPNPNDFSFHDDAGRSAAAFLHEKIAHLSLGAHEHAASWLRTRLSRAIDNPQTFLSLAGAWAERFALLMLPVGALLMRALTLRCSGYTLYDHFIFVMHSMSATGIVVIVDEVLSRIGLDVLSSWLLLIPPAHLFAHMRGVYGFGVAGTLLRMTILGLCSSIAILLLVFALAGFDLYNLPA